MLDASAPAPRPEPRWSAALEAEGGMRALQDGAAREADAAGSGCQRACGGGGRCGGQSGGAQDGNVRPVSALSHRSCGFGRGSPGQTFLRVA